MPIHKITVARHLGVVVALAVLAGCAGNKTATNGVPVEAYVTESAPVLEPAASEKPQKALFGFLKKKPDPEPVIGIEQETGPTVEVAPEIVVMTDLPRLQEPSSPSLTDDEIAARGPGENLVAPEKRPGLLGFLRNKERPENTVVRSEIVEQPKIVAVVEPEVESVAVAPSMTDTEIAAASVVPEGYAKPSTKPRLFGFLNKKVPGDVQGNVVLASAPAFEDPVIESPAILTPDVGVGEIDVVPANPRPSTTLGFGDFVKACKVRKRDLGTEVARSPGAGDYRLYDTNPSSIEPRIQYVTGFKDGCPRQFRAALALFGSPQVHETRRYDKRNNTAYSASDAAYEKAKNRVCRVSTGTPCPAKRYDKLEKQLAFLTAYRSFGTSGDWMEVVLFGGNVAGQSVH